MFGFGSSVTDFKNNFSLKPCSDSDEFQRQATEKDVTYLRGEDTEVGNDLNALSVSLQMAMDNSSSTDRPVSR